MGTSEAKMRRLYDEHYLVILAYFRRRVGAVDAHDATAEVFAVAWRRLDDVPDGEGARLWLHGVARNVLAHHQRSVRRQRRLGAKVAGLAVSASVSPEMVAVRRREDQEVFDALGFLKPVDREVLLLSAWEQLDTDEIATVLGITAGAVRQRLSRAKGRLGVRLRHSGFSKAAPVVEEGER